MSAPRWSPSRLAEFPQWLRNDADKIRNRPGYTAFHERTLLAADLLDAVLFGHHDCDPRLCPIMAKLHRVLVGDSE